MPNILVDKFHVKMFQLFLYYRHFLLNFYLFFFFFYIKLQSTDEKIELRIIGKIVPSLHDYINSDEFSKLILQEEPKLEKYLKIKIDGEIHNRIEKATKCWLYENVPQIVETEIEMLLQDITDIYHKMLGISQNFKGIAEIQLNSRLKLTDVSWTVAGGFAWVSNSVFSSFFIGPQAVLLISTFLGLFTLSSVVLQISIQTKKAEEIIKESFEKRVKSMDCEKLHDLLQKNLDKGLREFHRHIFTKVLPEAIQNMSFCVRVMEENKQKLEEKQDKVKKLLTKFNGCQNDVANIMTSVSKA